MDLLAILPFYLGLIITMYKDQVVQGDIFTKVIYLEMYIKCLVFVDTFNMNHHKCTLSIGVY